MNIPGGLTGAAVLLKGILPILKGLGLDPTAAATQMGRKQLDAVLDAGTASALARLEKDGITPAMKMDGGTAERAYIRNALYLVIKESLVVAFPPSKGKGANLAADAIRDRHDDNVVVEVMPHLDEEDTNAEALELIKSALIESLT